MQTVVSDPGLLCSDSGERPDDTKVDLDKVYDMSTAPDIPWYSAAVVLMEGLPESNGTSAIQESTPSWVPRYGMLNVWDPVLGLGPLWDTGDIAA